MKTTTTGIAYKILRAGVTGVYLDGKKVGEIRRSDGWQYFPKGHKDGGEVYADEGSCRRSLELDE